jgi:hypothetical protein
MEAHSASATITKNARIALLHFIVANTPHQPREPPLATELELREAAGSRRLHAVVGRRSHACA